MELEIKYEDPKSEIPEKDRVEEETVKDDIDGVNEDSDDVDVGPDIENESEADNSDDENTGDSAITDVILLTPSTTSPPPIDTNFIPDDKHITNYIVPIVLISIAIVIIIIIVLLIGYKIWKKKSKSKSTNMNNTESLKKQDTNDQFNPSNKKDG